MSVIKTGTTSTTGYIVESDTNGNLVIQTGSTPTTALTLNSNQTATFAQSVNIPNTFGFKNRIINGAMVIDQRNAGASQTITGGASTLAFNCDRWQVRSAGANATVQQIVTNNTYRMRFTGAASVSAVAAQQSIEALNCVDLAGGTATLSLVASSTSLTSLTLEAYYANTTNTFGTWGSPTVTSIGSQSVNISTTESTVSWTFSVPSAATTGIQIRITGGALGATQTLTIGNVQLERGSTATSFDYRPYGTELALCQRYYEEVWCQWATVWAAGMNNHNNSFRVTKRAVPTCVSYADTVAYAKTGATGNVRNTTSAANVAINAVTPDGSVNGFAIDYSTPAGTAMNMRATVTASAEL